MSIDKGHNTIIIYMAGFWLVNYLLIKNLPINKENNILCTIYLLLMAYENKWCIHK